jgi:hypothetical protein
MAFDLLTAVVSLGTGGTVGSYLTHVLRRSGERSDRRIAAYKAVLEALSLLRSAGLQLTKHHEWGQAPSATEFTAVNEAIKKACDLIEIKRFDTGSLFSNAANRVVDYWEEETEILWNNEYDAKPIEPTGEEREQFVLEMIPEALQAEVVPGFVAVLAEARAAHVRETLKAVEVMRKRVALREQSLRLPAAVKAVVVDADGKITEKKPGDD